MIVKFGRSSIYFAAAYLLVTVLATATSIIYGTVKELPPVTPGDSILHDPAFVATVPYHVLIMLIVWPIFAALYFRKPKGIQTQRKESLQLAVVWVVEAIVADILFFILIKHPYTLTVYEFYVLYQPWITLIYVSIFISPFLRLVLARSKNA